MIRSPSGGEKKRGGGWGTERRQGGFKLGAPGKRPGGFVFGLFRHVMILAMRPESGIRHGFGDLGISRFLGGVAAAAGGSGALRVFFHFRLLLQDLLRARFLIGSGRPRALAGLSARRFFLCFRRLSFPIPFVFCFFLFFSFLFRRARSVFRILLFFCFDSSFLTFVRCVLLASFLRGFAMGAWRRFGLGRARFGARLGFGAGALRGAIRCGLTRC